MRHRKAGRPLSRNGSHRRALFRNMVTSFLRCERIETTEAKAKEIRPIVERMISLGKKSDLFAKRLVSSYLMGRKVVLRLFSEVAPRFVGINGGYTRLIKTRVRHGDGAPMVVLELTKAREEKKEIKKEEGKKEAASS